MSTSTKKFPQSRLNQTLKFVQDLKAQPL